MNDHVTWRHSNRWDAGLIGRTPGRFAGFIHALRTSKDESFAAPHHTNGKGSDKELVAIGPADLAGSRPARGLALGEALAGLPDSSLQNTFVAQAAAERLAPTGVDLYWIPLGAGARLVRLSGGLFEALCALFQRRRWQGLYHSALVAVTTQERFVVEMTPIPRPRDPVEDRGVVGEGPVGTRWARRFRIFRYEIRRWRGGVIPDLTHAVGSPVRLADGDDHARELLDLVPLVPTPVWGRDELGAGEMWNSNSVTAWLLVSSGLDATVQPPRGGRAPGWDAGVAIASDQLRAGDAASRDIQPT